MDPVTVVDGQLFGAGVGTVIELQRDTAAKNVNGGNDWYYYDRSTNNLTSARARYYLKTVEGKYIYLLDGSASNLSENDRASGLQLKTEAKKVSTTIFARPQNSGDGVYVFNSGSFKDLQRTGLHFEETDMTAYTVYLGTQGVDNITVISLYREREDRVNVEPLYNALVEAKTYLESPNPYEADRLGAFLTQVEATLSLYNKYNLDSYSTTADGRV